MTDPVPPHSRASTKVPEVTLAFWAIKIAATTLGETAGDAVSMSMDLGYLVGTLIFAAIFAVAAAVQILSRAFHPARYWTAVIATTTVGTTLADFADRSLGIGYAGGSALLLALLVASLAVWHGTLGTLSIQSISSRKAEAFYWVTVMFSQTLGTALGDWTADTQDLGYARSALLFTALLVGVAVAHFSRRVSPTFTFWAAFILTRPLGAVVGDFLDKPVEDGGLALSRYSASAVLLAFIVVVNLFMRQRAAKAAQ
ncbi:MAG TPA: hypothetical protein VHE30_28450 [Polyangiaceae bacterium]|nr:hypothetical protein [Polyangiaceae bacterium]